MPQVTGFCASPLPVHSLLAFALLASAILSAVLTLVLLPVFRRHFVGEITARSDHRAPTPHGGGAAVIGAALVVNVGIIVACLPYGTGAHQPPVMMFLVVLCGVALLGLVDDRRGLPVAVRLVVQTLGAGMAVLALGASMPALEPLVLILLAGGGILALVWAMNAVNFVDGSDLITVAHACPALLGFALAFVALGEVAWALVAVALGGGLLGFAGFNRPPARLFLGDVGSLPIGFALGVFALILAMKGHIIAAIALVSYPAIEATTTLLWRVARGERLTEAHRRHAYQNARDRGWSAGRVAAAVCAMQSTTVAIGVALVHRPDAQWSGLLAPVSLGMVIAGAGGLIFVFRRMASLPS